MFLAAIELEPEKTDSVPEPDHFRNNALELLEKLRIQIEKRNLRQSRDQVSSFIYEKNRRMKIHHQMNAWIT
jgi:hypothetical protein